MAADSGSYDATFRGSGIVLRIYKPSHHVAPSLQISFLLFTSPCLVTPLSLICHHLAFVHYLRLLNCVASPPGAAQLLHQTPIPTPYVSQQKASTMSNVYSPPETLFTYNGRIPPPYANPRFRAMLVNPPPLPPPRVEWVRNTDYSRVLS